MALLQHVGHGDVQRHQGHVPVGGEHVRGGFGVVGDVGLGHAGDVPGSERGAAHDGDVLHQPGQLGVQAQRFGDVGERPDGQDPQLAGVFVGEPDQHLGGGSGHQLGVGRFQRDLADPVGAVDVRGAAVEGTNKRVVGSERDGDVGVPGELEQVQGVPGADGGTDVAADGADPPHVRLRRGEQVGQGEGVVDPGVAVEVERVADGRGHAGFLVSLVLDVLMDGGG